MSTPVVGGAASAATASLGRIAAGGFWRVVVAGAVLVLAAIVMTMSGGAGLGGGLGALFGLHTGQGGKPATAIQVAAPAPVLPSKSVVARVTPRRPASSAPGVRLRSRKPAATGPQRTPAPSTQPGSSPAHPGPVPAPAPPPASGNVQQVVRQVHDTVPQAVPAPAKPVVAPVAQPVLDQTTAAADQACGLIGGCP